MSRLSASIRIAVGLGCLSLSILLAAIALGGLPDYGQSLLEGGRGRLLFGLGAIGFLVQFFYLRSMLDHLDPSKVIPDRVRTALDTLAAGLVVTDRDERIVLANRSFARAVGRDPSQLQDAGLNGLPWTWPDGHEPLDVFPWVAALRDRQSCTGAMLALELADGERRTFLVNCAPIASEDGVYRGVFSSFDDVTPLQQKKADLARMLEMLRTSADEIRRQNQELQQLATRDPLTSCLNRRAFFQQFETHWKTAQRHGYSLCCAMVDVDHFKAINDTHGHVVGDQVLQNVAAVLRAELRDGDLICRFGGEEFCILLPHTELDNAAQAAERFRRAIAGSRYKGVGVTASVGVAALMPDLRDPQELLDRADRCLYAAKRSGRNRVVRWDEMPRTENGGAKVIHTPVPACEPDAPIPFQAVTALISALSYRDLATAEHSRRVADLCVLSADGLMSLGERYVLETAALLHDIGKVGVPDSILLKPGALTPEEWQVMRNQERNGAEIVRASFHSTELSAIIENHPAPFGGDARESRFPAGKDIPLGARLLAIADAYDAMISHRVYRKGRTVEEAFAELRRCAGTQFDPELVERFIERVQAGQAHRTESCDGVPDDTALSIGLQIERLSAAVDGRDLAGLQALAGRLQTVAAKRGVTSIAEQAQRLQETISSDADLVAVLTHAQGLLELCRSTQHAHLRRPAAADGRGSDAGA